MWFTKSVNNTGDYVFFALNIKKIMLLPIKFNSNIKLCQKYFVLII